MRILAITLGLGFFTWGCAWEPAESDYDDVAAGVGSLVANDSGGEVGAMSDSIETSAGTTPMGLSASGAGTVSGERFGLMYSYTVACSNASGDSMALCGSETDSASLSVEWSGELTLDRYAASVSRTGMWSLTGLQGDNATFNGMGTFSVDSEFMALYRDETRTWSFDYAATYSDVVLRIADETPLSGEIVYQIDAERTVKRGRRTRKGDFSVTATVTFNGDGTATVGLDGSRNYSLALGTGIITKISTE